MVRNLSRRLLSWLGYWFTDGALKRLQQPDVPEMMAGLSDPVRDYATTMLKLRKEGLETLKSLHRHSRLSQQLEGIYFEDRLAETLSQRYGPRFLPKRNAHLFSQTYEDSVIAEIFARIGEADRTFVEIGVESGRENVTRLLLMLGWRGVWVEADADACATIRKNFAEEIESGRLQLVEALAEPETIQGLIDSTGIGRQIDLLCVDIDQHTSQVFRAIETRARAACIEYNAHFAPSVEFEVAYDPDRSWDGSNVYGASLKTLELIGRDKNMSLVGCDLIGVNAYFVDDVLLGDHFLEPYTAEMHYQPPRFPYVRGRRGHPLPSTADG